MSTCDYICMFSLSCSSGYMSDLLVPFINKCNTKLCFKYIELLFLECEIIFREKKWQEWLQQNLNDRVLICINCLESFVEPGNIAKSGSKKGKRCQTWLLLPLLRSWGWDAGLAWIGPPPWQGIGVNLFSYFLIFQYSLRLLFDLRQKKMKRNTVHHPAKEWDQLLECLSITLNVHLVVSD